MAQQNKVIELVKALTEILKENDLGELEVRRWDAEREELEIRIAARGHSGITAAAPQQSVARAPDANAAPAAEPQPAEPENLAGVVTAPMVGTVYLQPEPDAPPFVEIGQQVAEGDTLVIIEAMKTMNHISAPHAGIVRRVLVENSTIVEFGSPLVIIE